jgi:hypothetical protein
MTVLGYVNNKKWNEAFIEQNKISLESNQIMLLYKQHKITKEDWDKKLENNEIKRLKNEIIMKQIEVSEMIKDVNKNEN